MILRLIYLLIIRLDLQLLYLYPNPLGLVPLKLLFQILDPECLRLRILNPLLRLCDRLKLHVPLGLPLKETLEFRDLFQCVCF